MTNNTNDPPDRRRFITFQVTPEIERRIKESAAHHGRNVSAHVRMAFVYFDTCDTLDYLDSPLGAAEVGDEIDQAREQVRADLDELKPAAFHRPSPFAGRLN